MEIISNLRKAVMFPGNYKETGNNLTKTDGITVMEYDYRFRRTRNTFGMPYGPIHSSFIELKFRNFSDKFQENILRDMKNSQATEYSILFNVTYDDFSRIQDFSEGFILNGYVVESEVDYSSYKDPLQQTGERYLQIKIKLVSINYFNDNRELKIDINTPK